MIHRDYNGILNDLRTGKWCIPETGQPYKMPIKNISTQDSLEDLEADLIASVHGDKSITIVSDKITHDILGHRIFKALEGRGGVRECIWEAPKSSQEGVDELRGLTRDAEALIAIGSGTINDSVKYATFLDGKEYSVFPTSPQNAYTTGTASISFGGVKKSLTAHFPKGCFIDLKILAGSPARLIRSAFADVICRTTAQVDWLMSHMLFDTPYSETPYVLLAIDETDLIADAENLLAGNLDDFGRLVRVCSIMGLGTSFVGTTHSGSMAEHSMSHYIDMFCNEHPATLHGEQVGVATLMMSRLQNQILQKSPPPVLQPTRIDESAMVQRYGKAVAEVLIAQVAEKAMDQRKADEINERWAKDWDTFAKPLRDVMLPYDILHDAMERIGAPLTGADLGLSQDFTHELVLHSNDVRNRFTMLDIAENAGLLDDFAETCT